MKRILITFGVIAAMAVAPSVASAGASSKASPHKRHGFILQVKSERGQTMYRLGNSGLWMN